MLANLAGAKWMQRDYATEPSRHRADGGGRRRAVGGGERRHPALRLAPRVEGPRDAHPWAAAGRWRHAHTTGLYG
jgi:hypothetical protein